MFRKVILLISIFVTFGLGIYFAYFHRPPTEDILAANLRDSLSDEDYDYDEDEDENAEIDESKLSRRKWSRWIRENKYVSIGALYNKCNGSDQIMLGRVIMLPDTENGGVTSRTYLNVTLGSEVTGGLLYLTCFYNGNELYSNHWDLCTVEDNEPVRAIICPIKAGRRKFIKQLKIPNYLPKGRYLTNAWLTDQNEEMIGCASAEFSI